MNKRPLQLSPSETLSQKIIKDLNEANKKLQKERDFQKYINRLQTILGLPPEKPLNEMEKYYVGGFIEGEGSISIGVKKNKTSAFGVYLDPAFNITQHVNGSIHLFRLLCYFQTGRIRYKAGSNATLVFEIDTRKSLTEKVCPFYQNYVVPCASQAKRIRFKKFCKVLSLFDDKAHLDKDRFLSELVPLWDELRMQKGQKNESFSSIQDLQQYVENFVNNKEKNSP